MTGNQVNIAVNFLSTIKAYLEHAGASVAGTLAHIKGLHERLALQNDVGEAFSGSTQE